MKFFKTSLSAKIVLVVGASLFIMSAVGFAFFDRFLGGQIEKSKREFSSAIGTVIVSSLSRSMLDNNRSSIEEMLANVMERKDILRADVIDLSGKTVFSSKGSDSTSNETIKSEGCVVCHRKAASKRPNAVHITLPSGKEVIRSVTPIENKPECHTCHGDKDRILGILLMDIDASEMHVQQNLHRMVALFSGGFMGFTLIVVISLFMNKLVTKPLNALSEAAVRIGNGELVEIPSTGREDIIGSLNVSMSQMVSNLKEIALKIANASQRVNTASDGLSLYSESIKNGALRQKSAVEETASSTREINITLKNILESIHNLSENSSETSDAVTEMEASIGLVKKSIDDLTGKIDRTSSSISQLATGTSSVAANIQELSATTAMAANAVEEINSSMLTASKRAGESEDISEDVIRAAEAGVEAVQKSVDGINRIYKSSRKAVEVIDRLGQRTREIGGILKVIAEVADRTNLLALNASIIAAQAGEHGRGFSVVAEEINNLAERTGQNTKMIAKLIKDVQDEAVMAVKVMESGFKDVESGVELTMQGGKALENILDSTRQSAGKVRDISSVMAEQSREINTIAKSIASIAETVSSVSNTTNEQAESNMVIVEAAREMHRIANHVQRAAKEQSDSSKLIARSIQNVDNMVRKIDVAVGELSNGNDQVVYSMSEINELAAALEGHVSQLEDMAGGLMQEGIALSHAVEKFKLY